MLLLILQYKNMLCVSPSHIKSNMKFLPQALLLFLLPVTTLASNCTTHFHNVGDATHTFCVNYTNSNKLPYCQALAQCNENGGMLLPSIDDLVTLLKHKYDNMKNRTFYVGVHRTQRADTLKWTLDNETFDFNDGGSSSSSLDCVVMRVSSSIAGLFDCGVANCSEKHHVICKQATRLNGGDMVLQVDEEKDHFPRRNNLCTEDVEVGMSQADTACALSCYRKKWCNSVFYRKSRLENECVISWESYARGSGRLLGWRYLQVKVSVNVSE